MNIEENIVCEMEIDPVIYRNQIFIFLEDYKKTKNKHVLIFIYIFIQMYVECFLHQNMRRIIRLEYQHSVPEIYNEWNSGEKENINDNRNRSGKLSKFIKYLFKNCNNQPMILKEEIEKLFLSISIPRNFFVHGHKIAVRSNQKGEIDLTEPRTYLDEDALQRTIEDSNQLGDKWNGLLNSAREEFKCLNKDMLKDFYFKKIILNENKLEII